MALQRIYLRDETAEAERYGAVFVPQISLKKMESIRKYGQKRQ
jgi:hypothetical protein